VTGKKLSQSAATTPTFLFYVVSTKCRTSMAECTKRREAVPQFKCHASACFPLREQLISQISYFDAINPQLT
jgi:hypothetical protein